MNIYFAVIAITYILIIVLAYAITIFTKLDEEKSSNIINKAFTNAFTILAFGLLVVYGIFILPHTSLSYEVTSYLILSSKFISILTLGGSLFYLTRKYYQH